MEALMPVSKKLCGMCDATDGNGLLSSEYIPVFEGAAGEVDPETQEGGDGDIGNAARAGKGAIGLLSGRIADFF